MLCRSVSVHTAAGGHDHDDGGHFDVSMDDNGTLSNDRDGHESTMGSGKHAIERVGWLEGEPAITGQIPRSKMQPVSSQNESL